MSHRRSRRDWWLVRLGAATLAMAAAAPISAQDGEPGPTLDLDHYVITFEERFSSLDVSPAGPGTRWIAHTPWHGDFGDAVFDDPGPSGPFSISSEGLRIEARRDERGRWHSGLICSMDRDGPGQKGFAQQFGYFEMRAKLPPGPGVWPAFWLIGVDKAASASEIDIVEFYGAFPGYFHSWMHLFRGGRDLLLADHLQAVAPGSLSVAYNDYGVSVEPDRTVFYLNRRAIWSRPTPPEYQQPLYMLADLAVGGGWPSDSLRSPVSMQIASILVFQDKRRLTGGPSVGQ